MDIGKQDLLTLDLADRYDDDLYPYSTLSWRDYALLYVIFAIVMTFIVWACFATVDELTQGQGKVVPSSEVQVIQNLEGGIIEKILVQEGDIVDEDQLLLQMSNIQAGAEYQASLKKFRGLQAAILRLQAEAAGAAPEFPDDMVKDAPESVALEMANYQANAMQRENQTNILNQQLDQRRQQVNEVRESMSGTEKVLALTREEYGMIAPLVERGNASKVELLQLKSKMTAQEAGLKNLQASLSGAESAMREVEEKLAEQQSAIKVAAQQDISIRTVEMETLREVLETYKDKTRRTEMRAPVRGTVKDIRITTEGGVVRPGETIMEIVPLDDLLIIEAQVRPADIAFLHPGHKAIIKLTAYDYKKYGTVEARVKEISADTIANEKGEHFYRIKLQSNETVLEHEGESLPIIPGMVASVDILTGKKTVMGYLLSRFTTTLDNSLHER